MQKYKFSSVPSENIDSLLDMKSRNLVHYFSGVSRFLYVCLSQPTSNVSFTAGTLLSFPAILSGDLLLDKPRNGRTLNSLPVSLYIDSYIYDRHCLILVCSVGSSNFHFKEGNFIDDLVKLSWAAISLWLH